jgi:hypothetical protein
MPEVTDTNRYATQTKNNREVSTLNALRLKTTRQSSFSDNTEEERNVVVKETLVSPPAVSSLVGEETPLMDFDDMLPHIGDCGLYRKILFTSLAPSAFFV